MQFSHLLHHKLITLKIHHQCFALVYAPSVYVWASGRMLRSTAHRHSWLRHVETIKALFLNSLHLGTERSVCPLSTIFFLFHILRQKHTHTHTIGNVIRKRLAAFALFLCNHNNSIQSLSLSLPFSLFPPPSSIFSYIFIYSFHYPIPLPTSTF